MKSTILWLFALVFLFAHESQASPFKLTFNGTVTSIFTDPSDPFASTIDIGTHMAGFVNYETTTTDAILSADVGSYTMFSSPPLGMALFIGGNTFAVSDFLNITVANNIGTGVDQLTLFAQQGVPGGLTDYLSMHLFLEDPSGTAFNSDALPLMQPDMGNFLVRDFFIDGVQTINGETIQFQIQGNVAVPEANTLILLSMGMVCFGFLRHFQLRNTIEVNGYAQGNMVI